MQVIKLDGQTIRTVMSMLEYARMMYGIYGGDSDIWSRYAKAEGTFKKQAKIPTIVPITFVSCGNQHIDVTVK